METTGTNASYYVIETHDLRPGDTGFWSWDEIDRTDDSRNAQKLYEQAQSKYHTLRLTQVKFTVQKLYMSVSPKIIDELESSLNEVEGNIRKHIIEFLKGVDLNDYPCEVRLAGGYIVTELILDYDHELVEVLFTGPDGSNDSTELSDFSTKEQLTILRTITAN